jgi:hypothetical protein
MKQEINELELESVVGGTVVISKDKMKVGFTTMGGSYKLVNCTYKQARNYVEDLKDANPGLTDAQFDALAKQNLQAKGWI